MKTSQINCMTHVESDGRQAVAAEMHVLVFPGIDGGFVAQGIEIDYVASGQTEEEARDHFAEGFCRTVRSYLTKGRDLSGLFKTATPAEYRQAYFASEGGDVFKCVVGLRSVGELPKNAPVPDVLNFINGGRSLAA